MLIRPSEHEEVVVSMRSQPRLRRELRVSFQANIMLQGVWVVVFKVVNWLLFAQFYCYIIHRVRWHSPVRLRLSLVGLSFPTRTV